MLYDFKITKLASGRARIQAQDVQLSNLRF